MAVRLIVKQTGAVAATNWPLDHFDVDWLKRDRVEYQAGDGISHIVEEPEYELRGRRRKVAA